MRFDQEFIEKVRDANNIVDIISQYTDLKGRGSQHMGLCPFPDHNESTPSFSVSEDKQLYHCFGCKKSGNLFTFLETYNGFSFVESVEFLARRAGIELPKETQGNENYNREKELKKNMFRANRFAAVFYYQQLHKLPPNHLVRQYLDKRGIPWEIAEEFRLGYAPDGWDHLLQFFRSQKVPEKLTERLGLIRTNQKGNTFDMFRDRLMFPIFSLKEEVVGFGGRIIDKGEPKYINSVESIIFKKGKTFYGLEKAVKNIRGEDRVFVVEGYMDLIALYTAGIKNVVATLGTALTFDHIQLLKRWTSNIVILFDGDEAGQDAAERSLPLFFAHGLSPQTLTLKDGMDPDDFIKEVGVDGFKEAAQKTHDMFYVVLSHWMKDYRGLPNEKLQLIDRISPLLSSLKDPRLKQIYIAEIAKRLGEEVSTVLSWLQKSPAKPLEVKAEVVEAEQPREKVGRYGLEKASPDELMLLGLSLKQLKLFDYFVKEQGLSYLSCEELKDIFSEIVAKYGQEPENFDKLAHLVLARVKNPEKIVNLINISSPFEEGDQDETIMKDCLLRVKDRFLQRQASILTAQIRNQPSDEKLAQIMNIQKDRLALKKQKDIPLGE